MKKLKMWYIKLAFAALFFAIILEFQAQLKHEIAPKIVQADLTSEQIQARKLEQVQPKAQKLVQQPESKSVQAEQTSKSLPTQKQAYPYRLIIPALRVDAGVVNMGLTGDGKMAVPNNYTEVGWYSLGTRPGEKGSVVMGAHVDNGGAVSGVFKNLKSLKIGDLIYVYDAQGNPLRYVVTDRKIYNYKTSSKESGTVFAGSDTARLNLITCYGTWLPKEKTYDSRLVVFATLDNTELTRS